MTRGFCPTRCSTGGNLPNCTSSANAGASRYFVGNVAGEPTGVAWGWPTTSVAGEEIDVGVDCAVAGARGAMFLSQAATIPAAASAAVRRTKRRRLSLPVSTLPLSSAALVAPPPVEIYNIAPIAVDSG